MAIKVEYAVQESITNIRRNLFMTFAAVMVVAVSLTLFGGVFLLRNAISRTADVFTGQVRVTVFLLNEVSNEERELLHEDLLAMPEVDNVTFETREQAYENFKRLFASDPDVYRNVDASALPESFRIQLKDPEQFTIIRDRLEGRPGIDRIRDERETVQRLFAVAGALRTGALVVAMVVGLAAILLIATTIRMAIYARRNEISIMKLVGATNWFIRVPFMLEGMVQGAVGALVAVVLLVAAKPLLSSFGPGDGFVQLPLKFTVTYGDIGMQAFTLLAVGIAVGAVGSLFGLRRFLDV